VTEITTAVTAKRVQSLRFAERVSASSPRAAETLRWGDILAKVRKVVGHAFHLTAEVQEPLLEGT
jgi:hypothetical protein